VSQCCTSFLCQFRNLNFFPLLFCASIRLLLYLQVDIRPNLPFALCPGIFSSFLFSRVSFLELSLLENLTLFRVLIYSDVRPSPHFLFTSFFSVAFTTGATFEFPPSIPPRRGSKQRLSSPFFLKKLSFLTLLSSSKFYRDMPSILVFFFPHTPIFPGSLSPAHSLIIIPPLLMLITFFFPSFRSIFLGLCPPYSIFPLSSSGTPLFTVLILVRFVYARVGRPFLPPHLLCPSAVSSVTSPLSF